MMWHANVARRQVLEMLLAGSTPNVVEVRDISRAVSGGENAFDVFWKNKPDGSVSDLPVLIVVDDSDLQEVIAMLSSAPQVPSPFTAFCRLVPRSFAPLLEETADRVRPEIIHGLTGLSLAEAAIYSGGNIRVSEISPAACRRTLAFVYGRALSQLPMDALPSVVHRWLETQSVLGMSTVGFERVAKALMPILDVAARVFLGLAPSDSLSGAVSEIVELGEPSESTWHELSSRHIRVPSLKFFAEATREDRSAAFQDVVRALYSGSLASVSDEAVASCALAGTRISPGTFEHLGLLAGHQDVRLPLWYAFFAALQRRGSALRASSALGLRVMRDMDSACTLSGAPTADISSDELMFVFRKNIEQLGKKLSHANEIVVELFPGLDASFRFGTRAERKEPHAHVDLAPPLREQTLNEKLDAARKLLGELSRELGDMSGKATVSKPPKKRAPKSNRLF